MAHGAFRCSEPEIDEGTFLICSKESNQYTEGDSRENANGIRMRGEDVLALGGFDLQIEQEEREGVNGKKPQRDPISGIPLPVEQSNKLLPGAAEGWNAEEDPCETNEIEDENAAGPAAEEAWGVFARALSGEEALDGEADAMNSAPDDKSPVRAVPQPPEQHGEHEIDVSATFPRRLPPSGI